MRRLASLLIAGVVVGACTDLPAIDPGKCGNAVVDEGEDCDSFNLESYVCRTEGAGACRYDCTANEDGERPPCPPGWGCGDDGICRKASGAYEAWGEPIEWPARQIFVADFDGDARDDVLTVADDVLVASFLDEDGAIEAESVLFIDRALPAVGDLTGDGIADLVVNRPEGLGVYRGQPDRAFSSTAYSSQGLPVSDARAAGLEVLPNAPGVEPVSLIAEGGGLQLIFVDLGPQGGQAPPTLVEVPSADAAQLPESMPTASFIEDPITSPCDEIVIAIEDAPGVLVATPCRFGPDGIELNVVGPGHVDPVVVSLDLGGKVHGTPLVFDMNGDDHLDLLIGATGPGGQERTHVAWGLGDGTFHSDITAAPPSGGDNVAPLAELGGRPLAVGHINDDGVPDYVLPDGIFVSKIEVAPGMGGGGPEVSIHHQPATSLSPGRWTHAIVADFNANGIADVVAIDSKSDGVDFFNGAGGGLLNEVRISTEGVVEHAILGDFDGDTVLDVALAEAPSGGDAEGDLVTVLFGRVSGALEPPVVMGNLGDVVQLIGGQIANDACYADGIWELAVLSRVEGSLNLAVLRGSTDRQLQAPFFLLREERNPLFPMGGIEIPSRPIHVAIGEFGSEGDEGPHADIGVLGGEGQSFFGQTSTCALDMTTVTNERSYRLWLAKATGEAELKTTTTLTGDALEVDLGFEQAIVTTADLDADGLDELVSFSTRVGDEDTEGPPAGDLGQLIVSRATTSGDGEATIFVSEEPQPMAEGFIRDAQEFLLALAEQDVPAPFTGLARAVAADLDGDDLPDVITQGITLVDEMGLRTEVIVVWNDGGALDVEGRVLVPSTPERMPSAFAVADVDGDAKPDIVLLYPDGARYSKLEGRTPSEPQPLPGVPGGRSLFAADLTRDGLPDLVVGMQGSARVFRAVPVRD